MSFWLLVMTSFPYIWSAAGGIEMQPGGVEMVRASMRLAPHVTFSRCDYWRVAKLTQIVS